MTLLPLAVGLALAGDPQTITIATGGDVDSLVSVLAATELDSAVLSATSLALLGSDFDCRLVYKPEIARKWTWVKPGRVLRMHLRDDIVFSDGHPLTTEDVVFTYELLGKRAVGSVLSGYLDRLEDGGRPAVIDDHTLEWRFTTAYSETTQLAHVGTVPILPAHVLSEVAPEAIATHALARVPLSTGPFQVLDHQPGVRIVLGPNSTHAGGRPHAERLVFKVLPDYDTRLHELRTGAVHAVADIDIEDLESLASSTSIAVHRRGWRAMDYIAWNLDNPLFADARTRRALALAVNADQLIADLLTRGGESYGRRSVGTITPALCDAHDSSLAPLPHDPDRARSLLAEVGWRDTDSDGILERGGQPFTFVLLTNRGNRRREAAVQAISTQLRSVGVDARVQLLDKSAFFYRLNRREFAAALAGWAAALFVDPAKMWHSGGVYNFPNYRSSEADALIDKGLSLHDPRKVSKVWAKLQARIYADQPYLFLYWIDEVVAVDKRVGGVHATIMSPWDELHRWRVE